MNSYLTNEEIAELKAIKAKFINDSDLIDLKGYLKKNGKEITISNKVNTKNTFQTILDSFPENVINYEAHRKYKNLNPAVNFSNEKEFVVKTYLFQLDSKLDKLYDITYSLDFDNAVRYISQKTNQIEGFDIISFLLNKDYDFKPFSIDSIDKTLVKNTDAINKVVSKWFESFTKELNEEQKTILSKNLFQTIEYFIKNSTNEKGNDFKKLVQYISNE